MSQPLPFPEFFLEPKLGKALSHKVILPRISRLPLPSRCQQELTKDHPNIGRLAPSGQPKRLAAKTPMIRHSDWALSRRLKQR
jgi:hypothetical protein